MAMKLLDLYKSILKTANLICTEDGCVDHILGKEKLPATVKGKRIVLPTTAHLANPDKENRVLFHPLAENQLRGESDVLEKFRLAMHVRFNYAIVLIATELLRIAASTADHAQLNPEQSEFLSHLKNVDQKTIDDFKKICENMPYTETQKSFVSVFLKRSGKIKDKVYKRCGIVTFPLYAELVKAKHDCYGVTLRVKDIKSLISLFEYIFPGIAEPEAYNSGSDSQVAPYLDALMKTVIAVASPLNTVVELFRSQIGDEEADELLFESEWVETFDNLAVMLPEIRSVPMQAGNEGKPTTGEAGVVAGVPNNPNPPAPMFAPTPVWQQTQQPQQQQMFQRPQVALPQPVATANGLDFTSVLRSNPALASAVGAYSQPQFAQGGQPRSAHNQILMNGGWQQPQQQQQMYNYGQRNDGFGVI